MGIWLLLILAFCAYIAADAAFDVSKKISAFVRLRALPVIRGVWGAVWGRRSVIRKSRITEAAPAAANYSLVDQPAKNLAISGVLAWLGRYRTPLLFLAGFVIVVSLMRGCSVPFIGKSRDTLRAELENAEADKIVLQHEADMEGLAGKLGIETERDAGRRAVVIAEVEQELEDAVSEMDFDLLFDRYTGASERLWIDPTPPDSPDPAPPRTDGVRGARAFET